MMKRGIRICFSALVQSWYETKKKGCINWWFISVRSRLRSFHYSSLFVIRFPIVREKRLRHRTHTHEHGVSIILRRQRARQACLTDSISWKWKKRRRRGSSSLVDQYSFFFINSISQWRNHVSLCHLRLFAFNRCRLRVRKEMMINVIFFFSL